MFFSTFSSQSHGYKLHVRVIGQMSKVCANDPGDRGSIPDRVIPKTQKMLLDADLLNTQLGSRV